MVPKGAEQASKMDFFQEPNSVELSQLIDTLAARSNLRLSLSCYFSFQLLHKEWARFGSWYKRQPFSLIKRYLGDKEQTY
jgi:hypothetical protein